MGRLVYSAITSLDGYSVDAKGHFDWSAPDAEVHAAVNELLAPVGTHLYGRRMYDVLVAWETMPTGPDQEPAVNEFARIWHAADKIVYSTTLAEASSDRTRIARDFDPETVRGLVADGDVSIGGPTIAAHAFRAGIVDEVHLFLSPVVVGGGTRALPDDVRLDLELVGERRFANGVVQLGYRVR
ncbi:dihydrofolate reductase family protein [soil metagenome]